MSMPSEIMLLYNFHSILVFTAFKQEIWFERAAGLDELV